jgi:hypothetical protein
VLIDTEFLGQMRKVLAWPNRNGFFYLIDRTNGKFLSAKAFVKQTWNDGFDFEKERPADGRPGHRADARRQRQGVAGIDGGSNWMAHSYSPLTKLFYVFRARGAAPLHEERGPASDDRSHSSATPAQLFNRGRGPRFAPEESWGKAIAIEPSTGAIKWEHRVVSPPWGGLMRHGRQSRLRRYPRRGDLRPERDDRRAAVHLREQRPCVRHAVTYLADGKQLCIHPGRRCDCTLWALD